MAGYRKLAKKQRGGSESTAPSIKPQSPQVGGYREVPKKPGKSPKLATSVAAKDMRGYMEVSKKRGAKGGYIKYPEKSGVKSGVKSVAKSAVTSSSSEEMPSTYKAPQMFIDPRYIKLSEMGKTSKAVSPMGKIPGMQHEQSPRRSPGRQCGRQQFDRDRPPHDAGPQQNRHQMPPGMRHGQYQQDQGYSPNPPDLSEQQDQKKSRKRCWVICLVILLVAAILVIIGVIAALQFAPHPQTTPAIRTSATRRRP